MFSNFTVLHPNVVGDMTQSKAFSEVLLCTSEKGNDLERSETTGLTEN